MDAAHGVGEPHGLEHIKPVRTRAGVGADAHVQPSVDHAPHLGDADAQAQVAGRVVGHRGAAVGEAADIVVIHPHGMGGGEVGTDDAQVVEMGGQSLAVLAHADHRLHLGFGQVAMDADPEFVGQFPARAEERILAMMGDGRRQGQTHPVAVEGPVFQGLAAGGDAGLGRFRRHPVDLGLEGVRQASDESGDGLPEAAVGHQGRHHGAHADVGVASPHRRQTLGRGGRKLGKQIVTGPCSPTAPFPPPPAWPPSTCLRGGSARWSAARR